MNTPKFCRIAIVVDDMRSFISQAQSLLGIPFVRPKLDEQFVGFHVMFGEHGLEPIELETEMPFAKDGRLIEVAIDVQKADETRLLLERGGYRPIVTNFLPVPAANEYLFGRDFHGLPLMVCTAGDNEAEMRAQGPFLALDEAPLPKIGCVSVVVDDLERAAADFTKFFGMRFVPADPAGLGERALVGPHRLKLVAGPSPAMAAHYEMPLAAIEFMVEDLAAAAARFTSAGHRVLHERSLDSGRKTLYFGAAIQRMPVGLYCAADDDEVIGRPR
jgi:catechol 2,3-dioxygenase-like lactoylglutathione lyase family enzyme